MSKKFGWKVGAAVAAVLLTLGVASPAQATSKYIYNTLPCSGAIKHFKTIRYNTQADVYFYLSKAAGVSSPFGGLNYADTFGTTIYGNDDYVFYAGGGQGKYLMTGFIIGTPFKLLGSMPAKPVGGTCDNSWNGTLTF